jgi:hypothetical protein
MVHKKRSRCRIVGPSLPGPGAVMTNVWWSITGISPVRPSWRSSPTISPLERPERVPQIPLGSGTVVESTSGKNGRPKARVVASHSGSYERRGGGRPDVEDNVCCEGWISCSTLYRLPVMGHIVQKSFTDNCKMWKVPQGSGTLAGQEPRTWSRMAAVAEVLHWHSPHREPLDAHEHLRVWLLQ